MIPTVNLDYSQKTFTVTDGENTYQGDKWQVIRQMWRASDEKVSYYHWLEQLQERLLTEYNTFVPVFEGERVLFDSLMVLGVLKETERSVR